jgi:tRNA(Ile)-lysidine synthetase-like protein
MDAFIKEWFENPDWWFSKNPIYDTYITDKYHSLLQQIWDDSNSTYIQRIILWDQLPRHVYRNHPNERTKNFMIEDYMWDALKEVEEHEADCENLSNMEWIFFWLPVRHTKDPELIFQVMKKGWARLESHGKQEGNEWLRKFIRATYLNCPTENQDDFLDPLDSQIIPFDSVLETNPPPTKAKPDVSKAVWEKHTTVIVSLSGGVDSMVMLQLAKQFYNNVVAVHINYANRETSFQEASMVKDWCIKNDILLVTRTINEIKRKPCMENGFRAVYETYTKNVRFGTYKTVWRLLKQEGEPVVLLGHNRDDCFENVMTNATFQSKYDNLFGMQHWFSQSADGIRFGRPLLSIPKANIYAYANFHDIPHLYDSTVSWCQRGKIRDSVVPTLLQWNEKSVDGLLELASVTQELYQIMKQSVDSWIGQLEKGEITVDKFPVSSLFWKEFFIRGLHIYPSNKAVQYLLIRLKKIEEYVEVNVLQKVMLHKFATLHITKTKSGKFVLKIVS